MATHKHTTAELAKATAFICKLFDPLPDAELADPELPRLEQRARALNWKRHFEECRRLKAARDQFRGTDNGKWWKAHADLIRAEHHMIVAVPAPTERAVNWKRRRAGRGSEYLPGGVTATELHETQHVAAIADDEARLGLALND